MNKTIFTQIYINWLNQVNHIHDIRFILTQYIKDMKGEDVDIDLNSISRNQILAMNMVDFAILYYVDKFNARILIKQNGDRIILC